MNAYNQIWLAYFIAWTAGIISILITERIVNSGTEKLVGFILTLVIYLIGRVICGIILGGGQ